MARHDGRANLRVPTSEEARINGRKGGIASGKARNAKKDARKAAEAALYDIVLNDAGIRALKRKGLKLDDSKDINGMAALMAGLLAESIKGNSQAARTLLEVAGAVDKEETTIDIDNKSGVIMLAPIKEEVM